MKFPPHSLSGIQYLPHGPSYGLTLPSAQAGGRKVPWNSILTMYKHLTVRLGMKTQFCTVFLISSPNQTPFGFAHPSLVAYQRWFCFQEGRLLSASFPLKVNSTGTALWKRLKLNLSQDSHHQPPRWFISVAERLPASLSFLYSPDLENQLALGGSHLFVHKRSTWGWLTALCCYSWVRVNSRWCMEISNK